ncbi:ATP-binding protein [Malacoplasma penetrans]|uniref:ATP-binding protein n=1 Tax=Malacoplasma penetrans TaxID=28227 RepID=UPI001010A48D|nr:DUF4143 domain-containing protein [Malacoplasma penetrans]RXY97216.1 ATP-binding protein [Malacoplasma penetrans]
MNIKRNILNALENLLQQYPIVLLTGSRQVGKTTLTTYYQKNNNYKYVSLENEDDLKLAKRNPGKFLEKYQYPLIIDEVQLAPILFNQITHIVNEIRRLHGSNAARGLFILISSQKYHLMKNVTESMAGRVAVMEMGPLSLSEINQVEEKPFFVDKSNFVEYINRTSEYKIDEEKIYQQMIRGFYPEICANKNLDTSIFYKNYIDTYIERDVSKLENVRSKKKFKEFLVLLSNYTANDFVPENLSKLLGVDIKTINSWTSILEAGNIITLVSPFSEKINNKQVTKRQRIYFNDTGLVCNLLDLKNTKDKKFLDNKEKLFETFVFNEINKTYINKNQVINFYYYRDLRKNEIDLVVLDGYKNALNLIECKSGKKYDLSDVKFLNEFKSNNYEIASKLVICLTKDFYSINSNIHIFPITCI